MSINSFRDLRVWQAGMDLVEQISGLTQHFPRHERFGLASQLQRAAVSVPSNIAEGHTREHTREDLHHVSMAQASLAEVETQLEIALRLKYVASEQALPVRDHIATLGKQLYHLRDALKRRLSPAPGPQPRQERRSSDE